MPYVNCPECSTRSFALAPWSSVDRCPLCDAALAVPRQSVTFDRTRDRTRQEDQTALATQDGQPASAH